MVGLPRHPRNKTNSIDIAKVATELSVLKSSPLGAIIAGLEEGLTFVEDVFNRGGCPQSDFELVITQTNAVLQLLPKQFSDRFSFDVQMIHAIKESWNGDGQRLSHYVIPVNGDVWGHQGMFMPVGNQGKSSSINVIHFPGASNIRDTNLLDYPFLCHELAHNLYFFDDSFFRECFDEKLKASIDKLRLQSI